MKATHALLTSLLISSWAGLFAADAQLKIGDVAPQLACGTWVQGKPIGEFERGKAYLIDFWATWCGPCLASIPQIEHLHQRYKDQGLVVIGQDVWEEDVGKVKPLVEKMGDKMTFRIALDDDKGTMAKTWLKAAGEDGIPTAFLVGKDGKIAWIDHSSGLSETVIEQVLAGTFDVAKEGSLRPMRKKLSESYFATAQELSAAIKDKRWLDAHAALEQMRSIVPGEDVEWIASIEKERFRFLVAQGKTEEAIKLGESILAAEKNATASAMSLAWMIGQAENPPAELLSFAETCAKQANEATHGREPRILETLARVLFRQGKHRESIESQQHAINSATSPDEQKRLGDDLADYQNGHLPGSQDAR